MSFPPIASKFDAARELADGDYVYVRMRVFRVNREGRFAACRVYDTDNKGFHQLPVPLGRIICREPPAMEYDQGVISAVSGL